VPSYEPGRRNHRHPDGRGGHDVARDDLVYDGLDAMLARWPAYLSSLKAPSGPRPASSVRAHRSKQEEGGVHNARYGSDSQGRGSCPGGALFGAAVGQLKGPNLRQGIKQDLELLEQMPEIEAARQKALRRSIDDRIDELIVAEDTARRLRAAAISYQGNWRDIVLFLCTVLFSVVWWSADHDRDSWLPMFITTIVASVVAAGYTVRALRRSMRRVGRHADRGRQSK
jgi:hypothetical protein